MNKSNIFVYNELEKLVTGLSDDIQKSKRHLKAQAGYFNIIPAKYFSEDLSAEWEMIVASLKQKGPKRDEDGRVIGNAIVNTIEEMSNQECFALSSRIIGLYEKVRKEFM